MKWWIGLLLGLAWGIPAFAQVHQQGAITPGHCSEWLSNNFIGDSGGACGGGGGGTPGGSNGQIQYNNAGAFGGFNLSGDCTEVLGVMTCLRVNGVLLAAPGSATTDTTNAGNISSGTIGAARLPLGSASAFGAVKADGTTITASGGVLSAVTGGSGNVLASGSPTSGQCAEFTGSGYNVIGGGCSGGGGSPGGSNGQIQYNNSGAFGGFNLSGDCTETLGAMTCLRTNGTLLANPGSAVTDTTNANNISSGTLGAARLPLASASAFGAVKVDGTTITATGGVISAPGGGGGNVVASGGVTSGQCAQFTGTGYNVIGAGCGGGGPAGTSLICTVPVTSSVSSVLLTATGSPACPLTSAHLHYHLIISNVAMLNSTQYTLIQFSSNGGSTWDTTDYATVGSYAYSSGTGSLTGTYPGALLTSNNTLGGPGAINETVELYNLTQTGPFSTGLPATVEMKGTAISNQPPFGFFSFSFTTTTFYVGPASVNAIQLIPLDGTLTCGVSPCSISLYADAN